MEHGNTNRQMNEWMFDTCNYSVFYFFYTWFLQRFQFICKILNWTLTSCQCLFDKYVSSILPFSLHVIVSCCFSSKITWKPFLSNFCDTLLFKMTSGRIIANQYWPTCHYWNINDLDTGCRVSSWSRLGQQGEGDNEENCDEHLCCCLFFFIWQLTDNQRSIYLLLIH